MSNLFACLYKKLPTDNPSPSGTSTPSTWIKVVSFWTGEQYWTEIQPLHASLLKLNLCYETRHVEKSNWLDAVLHKPAFMLQQLRDTTAAGILWTDADSAFLRKPDFSVFKDVDVSWNLFRRHPIHVPEYLTGTMFFRNTPDVLSFLEEWTKETGENPEYRKRFTPEQDSLRQVWDVMGWKSRLRFLDLPPAWVGFDDMKELHPGLEVVVAHRQASRKYRHAQKEQEAQAQNAAAEAPALAPGKPDEQGSPAEAGSAGPSGDRAGG